VTNHAGFSGAEVLACVAPTVMLVDVAVAGRRATAHLDRSLTGRVECAPAVAGEKLGPFVRGHHPWPLAQQIIFWALPSGAVQDDDLHATAPQGFDASDLISLLARQPIGRMAIQTVHAASRRGIAEALQGRADEGSAPGASV
jgi:hypothetical protein